MLSPTRRITSRIPVLAIAVSLVAAALVALTVPAAGPARASTGRPVALRHHGVNYVPKHFTVAITNWYAKRMLDRLNAQRGAMHRAPLRMNAKLVESAGRHTLRMARTNTMSHQLRGEPDLGTRISATGYRWRMAGENIGWNSNLSLAGLWALERAMFREKPPNDGHRLNILSRAYRQIGIAVRYDARHHKIWFTQDFGAPA